MDDIGIRLGFVVVAFVVGVGSLGLAVSGTDDGNKGRNDDMLRLLGTSLAESSHRQRRDNGYNTKSEATSRLLESQILYVAGCNSLSFVSVLRCHTDEVVHFPMDCYLWMWYSLVCAGILCCAVSIGGICYLHISDRPLPFGICG